MNSAHTLQGDKSGGRLYICSDSTLGNSSRTLSAGLSPTRKIHKETQSKPFNVIGTMLLSKDSTTNLHYENTGGGLSALSDFNQTDISMGQIALLGVPQAHLLPALLMIS